MAQYTRPPAYGGSRRHLAPLESRASIGPHPLFTNAQVLKDESQRLGLDQSGYKEKIKGAGGAGGGGGAVRMHSTYSGWRRGRSGSHHACGRRAARMHVSRPHPALTSRTPRITPMHHPHAENKEKIKLNNQLPYLVANIVEVLDVQPEEEEEEDGGTVDLDAQRKGAFVDAGVGVVVGGSDG